MLSVDYNLSPDRKTIHPRNYRVRSLGLGFAGLKNTCSPAFARRRLSQPPTTVYGTRGPGLGFRTLFGTPNSDRGTKTFFNNES